MTKVTVHFRFVNPQIDGAEMYSHNATGYVHTTNYKDLIVLVREVINIQEEIYIVAHTEYLA